MASLDIRTVLSFAFLPPWLHICGEPLRRVSVMATIDDLELLLSRPTEALDVEYKSWLDLQDDEHKGNLAKAAIALANEGGGHIVVGIREVRPILVSEPRPPSIAAYDQDLINQIVRRFATPAFHCTLHLVPHPGTGHEHAVISNPGRLQFPRDVEERHPKEYNPASPLLYTKTGARERTAGNPSRLGPPSRSVHPQPAGRDARCDPRHRAGPDDHSRRNSRRGTPGRFCKRGESSVAAVNDQSAGPTLRHVAPRGGSSSTTRSSDAFSVPASRNCSTCSAAQRCGTAAIRNSGFPIIRRRSQVTIPSSAGWAVVSSQSRRTYPTFGERRRRGGYL
jgi:hypothetical protein